MQIGITINNENYLKAFSLRQERKLSGLINSFLTNYFSQEDGMSDLVAEEIKLEKEKLLQQEKINDIATKLTIIKIKIENEKQEKQQEQQEQLKESLERQDSIKRTGLIDQVMDNF